MSSSIGTLVERIGNDLQTLEDALKAGGEIRTKVRFPRGVLRTATYFREKFWFIRSENLRRNIAYTLILSDVYRWVLNRNDLWGTPREMLIKEGVCLVGSLAESITKDALRGVCSKNTGYKARIKKLRELDAIDGKLQANLEWLWDYRNREHLFLVDEWEYGHYKLQHYNKAILTLRGLRDGLDKYFRELETPFLSNAAS
jgi:hypothetical protein